MLVFTRKKEQSLVIGDKVEIKVLHISRDSVKLGIKAPLQIPVHRWEVFEAIRAQDLEAVGSESHASAHREDVDSEKA